MELLASGCTTRVSMPVVRNSLNFVDRCLSTEIDAFVGSTFIELDDVHVPVDHLIGQENKGFPLIMSSEF